MCSFIFTDIQNFDIDHVNYYTKFRGPDGTNVVSRDGYTWIHNLLSITGKHTIQPFVDGQIGVAYNGELYNYQDFGDYESDGECLIDLYKKHGPEFVKLLDGEFAICLADTEKDKLVIATDPFATKPLWYSIQHDALGVASYQSAIKRLKLQGERLPANQCHVYTLSTRTIEDRFEVVEWDLNQHKDSFDDWTKAFEEAVRKRAVGCREKIFIGLSSGYDSGAISCALNKMDVPYTAFSVLGREHQGILNERHERLKENSTSVLMEDVRYDPEYDFQNHIIEAIEPVHYDISSSSPPHYHEHGPLTKDGGFRGLVMICDMANEAGLKVNLSGSGADEITSDYGHNGQKYFAHSNFGGKFPDDLATIFPWNSFYESSQASYIAKEEYAGGSYGIETRYPFLDKAVVQEFLWLTPELKNSVYKAPISNYLGAEEYPFEANKKRGF